MTIILTTTEHVADGLAGAAVAVAFVALVVGFLVWKAIINWFNR